MELNSILFAFLLTLIAGLSTGIGGLISLLTKHTNTRFLSYSLGLSAGVMIYVSFVEILPLAQHSLTNIFGIRIGGLYAALSFFGGMLLIAIIDKLVPSAENPHEMQNVESISEFEDEQNAINQSADGVINDSADSKFRYNKKEGSKLTNEKPDNAQDSKKWGSDLANEKPDNTQKNKKEGRESTNVQLANAKDSNKEGSKLANEKPANARSKAKLMRMGVATALVIAIHNFPEGIATFMSALESPALGIAIASAIAIHNIPEGIAVAVPVYFATRNRKKAFWYSLSSGLAEPVGAVVGYFILYSFLSPVVMAVIFGSVAGIMVFISLDELLPAAREWGEHHISIWGVISGMAIMAISLVLI